MRRVLNLYLISQTDNLSDEAYHACIVAEESIVRARQTLPIRRTDLLSKQEKEDLIERHWTDTENVSVKYIGEAADDIKHGVIISTMDLLRD